MFNLYHSWPEHPKVFVMHQVDFSHRGKSIKCRVGLNFDFGWALEFETITCCLGLKFLLSRLMWAVGLEWILFHYIFLHPSSSFHCDSPEDVLNLWKLTLSLFEQMLRLGSKQCFISYLNQNSLGLHTGPQINLRHGLRKKKKKWNH